MTSVTNQKRPTKAEYEELGIIAETYWESVVSIARYTRALERHVHPGTVERIRADVGLDPAAAMVIDDPTPEEAA